KIDGTPPASPTLTSPSHSVDVWSNDPTVEVAWSGQADANSGVDGFSYAWSAQSDTDPGTGKTMEETATGTTSDPLADGSWWFHLRTGRSTGSWSDASHIGPFRIDTTAPETTIVSAPPAETSDRSAAFAFASNETSSSFSCSLDGAAYGDCASPFSYAALEAGAHVFRATARDRAGNADPTPAEHRWTIGFATPPAPPPPPPPPPAPPPSPP